LGKSCNSWWITVSYRMKSKIRWGKTGGEQKKTGHDGMVGRKIGDREGGGGVGASGRRGEKARKDTEM